MKLVHLILAHTEPVQIERLICKLSHPDADIYIHLDKKIPADQFEHLQGLDRVYFIKNRVEVYWGTYGIVKATISSFKEIESTGKKYDYLNLLSGQDYPLKSSATIHQYLDEHPGTIYMNYLLMDPDWTEALSRISHYHLDNIKMPGKYMLQRMMNKFLPRRKFPNGLIPVGRSQWFTLPMECVKFIIDYWQQNPSLRQFIKYTWAPDEFIFQTILYNSIYRGKMVNNDLRYIDWSAGGVSPKTLSMDDAHELLETKEFYARKFNINKDAKLLDLIDQHMAAEYKMAVHH